MISECVVVDSLLEHTPMSAVRCGLDGTILFANSEWLHRMGLSASQVINRPFADVIITPGYDLNDYFRHVVAGGVKTYETSYDLPQIGRRHLDVVMVPAKGCEGEIQGVLIFINDTTAKFALEAVRKDASDYLLALNAHAIVAVTDSSGVITWANEKFCEISQYSREELYGRTHSIVNSGTHPKSFFVQVWRTIAGGDVWQGEICNRAKDGSLYWVYTTIVPIIGRKGNRNATLQCERISLV